MNAISITYWLAGYLDNLAQDAPLSEAQVTEIREKIQSYEAGPETDALAVAETFLAFTNLNLQYTDPADMAATTGFLKGMAAVALQKIEAATSLSATAAFNAATTGPFRLTVEHYARFFANASDDYEDVLVVHGDDAYLVREALERTADYFRTYDLLSLGDGHDDGEPQNVSPIWFVGFDRVYTKKELAPELAARNLTKDFAADPVGSLYVLKRDNNTSYMLDEAGRVFDGKGQQVWPKLSAPKADKNSRLKL